MGLSEVMREGTPPSSLNILSIAGMVSATLLLQTNRLAGVDEAGATEALRFVPTEEAVMEKVVSMYDHRKKE